MEGVPRSLDNGYRWMRSPIFQLMKERKISPMKTRGGYIQVGAEQKAADEPVMLLHETMPPQIYCMLCKEN